MYPVPPLWVPACAGMTEGSAGRMGCSPSPSDPLLISPWEGEGDGSRERGFNCEWFTLTLALSHLGRGGLIGVLCFSLDSRLRGNDGGWHGNDGGLVHPHPRTPS